MFLKSKQEICPTVIVSKGTVKVNEEKIKHCKGRAMLAGKQANGGS